MRKDGEKKTFFNVSKEDKKKTKNETKMRQAIT